jgi:CRP-like cAMP-binding protein
MTEATRSFKFAEVADGSWIGEEAVVSDSQRLNYTVRAKTSLKVLEIAVSDLRKVLTPECTRFLTQMSIDKHVMQLERIK